MTRIPNKGFVKEGGHKKKAISIRINLIFGTKPKWSNDEKTLKKKKNSAKSTFEKCVFELKWIGISVRWCIVLKHLLKQCIFDFP